MTERTAKGRLARIADDFVTAYNAKDFTRVRGFFADDLVFCHHNRGFELVGADALVALLAQFASEIVPDRQFRPATRVTEAGNVLIREQPWGGRVLKDIPGMAKAGDDLQLALCTVFVFDGDRIAEYHDYG
jgi:ketosteroid isomerase-like protein